MPTVMVDHTEAVLKRVQAELDRRIRTAAGALAAEHRADLSTADPPHSKVGQFPHRETGNLIGSVAVVPVQSGQRVGYRPTAAYVLHLARSGRKTLAHTARRVRAALKRIVEGK